MIASTLTAEQLEWLIRLTSEAGRFPLTEDARERNHASWACLCSLLAQADRARPAAAARDADGALDGS